MNTCPKHNIPLMLRQNAKTGELALGCPYCDLEAQGGSEADKEIIAGALEKMKTEHKSE